MTYLIVSILPMIATILTTDQVAAIARWSELKRWEKRELGQDLRRLGLSYGEITAVIPVAKGTLSGWCRDLPLSDEHMARVARHGTERAQRLRIGHTRRLARLAEIETIRKTAAIEAESLLKDPFWVAGVVAYWAEGAKRNKDVQFSNSDPNLIKLFIRWAQDHLDLALDRFTISIHLHDGQIESQMRAFWSEATGIPLGQFRKGFIKPEGTGHRKNVLYNGTASIRITRSTDLLIRILGWIDALGTWPHISLD